MKINYREFNFFKEDIEPIFHLMELAYKNVDDYKSRWEWQYKNAPNAKDIKIFIAEHNGKIIASTSRFPVVIHVVNRVVDAMFSVDSVVHPDYRRKGVMEGLYRHTAKYFPIMLSKGTNPSMYKLLLKMGYKEIRPNNYMISALSPVRLLMKRAKLSRRKSDITLPVLKDSGEYTFINRFGDEFDDFWERVSGQYAGIVYKNSKYMNWRYKDIPGREYHAYYRKEDSVIISMIVVRVRGDSGAIVDFIWDRAEISEPYDSLGFAIRLFKKAKALKAICWGTYGVLRDYLGKKGFIEWNSTPRFSVYTNDIELLDFFTNGANILFVEGDGDSEFL